MNYGHSKSIVAAFVATAVMAAGFAAPALADIEAANRGGGSNAAPTKTPIKHVVIIFGENESFDHYFATYPNAKNTELPLFKAAPDTPAVN
ncbi:MAG TPA: alkaline phosphatase family protein, partial [Steroidobacteraceae bacterium]